MAKKNNNKGVNVEKVSKLLKDAPSVEEIFADVIVEEELVENNMVGGKEMEELRIVEMEAQDVKEVALGEIVEEAKEIVENMEENEMQEFINIVNANIKGAITFYKNYVTDKKVVSGKQIQSVQKQYKNVTGVEMSKEQLDYMKKLNDKQVGGVIYVLNQALKHKKQMAIA